MLRLFTVSFCAATGKATSFLKRTGDVPANQPLPAYKGVHKKQWKKLFIELETNPQTRETMSNLSPDGKAHLASLRVKVNEKETTFLNNQDSDVNWLIEKSRIDKRLKFRAWYQHYSTAAWYQHYSTAAHQNADMKAAGEEQQQGTADLKEGTKKSDEEATAEKKAGEAADASAAAAKKQADDAAVAQKKADEEAALATKKKAEEAAAAAKKKDNEEAEAKKRSEEAAAAKKKAADEVLALKKRSEEAWLAAGDVSANKGVHKELWKKLFNELEKRDEEQQQEIAVLKAQIARSAVMQKYKS